MAREYYTLDEAADVLGVSVDDVRAMVGDGRLQEYEQDGAPVFKIEDVERVVANEGSSIVDLAITENQPTGEQIAQGPLAEPTSDIDLLGFDDSSADLAISPTMDIPESQPAAKAQPEAAPPKPPKKSDEPESSTIALAEPSDIDLTALDEAARDTGLSASDVIALEEADERPAPSKEDTKITNVGISVFDDSDLQIESDPLAKTHITTPAEQQMALESVGSGSGLLDLTRESDDTSLGAELLDVISPSEGTETETQAEPIDSDTGTLEAESVETTEAEYDEGGEPVSAQAEPALVAMEGATVFDPSAPAFTGIAVVTTISLVILGLAATSQIQGVWPSFMELVDSGMNLYIFFGATLGLAGLAWLIGWLVGRSGTRKPAAPKGAES